MAKKVKVLDMTDYIRLICIKDNTTDCNPFSLFLVYRSVDRYGYPADHRKRIAKYQDMTSVLCMIKDLYCSGIQYEPVDMILSWCKQYYGN